jgi:hypothetical protein
MFGHRTQHVLHSLSDKILHGIGFTRLDSRKQFVWMNNQA